MDKNKIMIVDERMKQKLANLERVKKWAARINALANRKKNPMKEAEFCRKHKLQIAGFNRNKNGICFPNQKTIAKVEAAFKAEKV